jgi:hypothetical protein
VPPAAVAEQRKEADTGSASNQANRTRAQGAAASQTRTASALASAVPSPEKWLQRIADLRRQGRHEEADRELTEFRKRYPNYRLSDEMKAKVERQ